MSWSIKLFKVRGIDVKVHLTFVLILIWAAYIWSNNTGAGIQGALFGVVATLLLFVAVTLHELGHSFQAIKFGVHVRDITLMPMGGLAQMEKIPEKSSEELRIAIAGPLVNFAIAGVLVILGALLQVRSIISIEELSQSVGQVSWSGMLAYLTMANLALGLFNLIPAFPMDGGRVLRALLAMRMDYTKATQIAANIGQGLALLLGLWGFMSGSYTMVLIAIFVWIGAGQESKEVIVKDVLRDIKVRQAMTLAPQTLKANDMLSKAAELTLSTAQSDFPVIEWGTNRVIGVLGEKELLRGLQKHNAKLPVSEVMHANIPVITQNEPLYLALEKMAKVRMRAAPVVDGEGQLVGLLTTADVNEAYRLFSIEQSYAPATR
jgi:Zn-dependent protease/predicted transcriptional regulator